MTDQALEIGALDSQLAPALDAPRWYVALSGGVDSSVLLHLLKSWCDAHPQAPSLSAIHINHGLQAGAGDWQAHCAALCAGLDIPLVTLTAQVHPGRRGLEAAAREARYRLFENQLQSAEILFLGHHLDDQVETFFLRLLRGAGVQGLAAMPAERGLGCGRLLRPLLDFPRTALLDYAVRHGLAWVDDPSNSETALDRNFLRAQVLPVLESRWPGYRRTVGRASALLGTAAAQLRELTPPLATVRSAMNDPGVSLAALVGRAPADAALILRRWLQSGGLPAPDHARLMEFLRQLEAAGEVARPRLECSAYSLQRHGDAVYLLPAVGLSAPVPPPPVPVRPGELVALGAAGSYVLEQAAGAGLYLGASDPLTLVWRRGGERCRPAGRVAGSASLKQLLQEHRVPPWWRPHIPLLYLGDELLAVGDLWLCDSSRLAAAAGPAETRWRPRWERNITKAFD